MEDLGAAGGVEVVGHQGHNQHLAQRVTAGHTGHHGDNYTHTPSTAGHTGHHGDNYVLIHLAQRDTPVTTVITMYSYT